MKNKTALIIGGAGAVGTLFCTLLQKIYTRVVVLDINIAIQHPINGIDYIQGDIAHNPPHELLAHAELILLATPEKVAVAAVASIHQILQTKQCLVDTMSVKSKIVPCLTQLKPSYEVLSINPMFGPSLGFKHQSVACVTVNHGPISQKLLTAIVSEGSEIIELDAESHDRYTAATQAATHAAVLSFGLTLQKMQYQCEQAQALWTPPHKVLLSLLARILAADSEVYRDIQAANPYANTARKAMQESIVELDNLVTTKDSQKFEDLFESLRPLLGSNKKLLADTCQSIFKNL